jgi:hypothetical protein
LHCTRQDLITQVESEVVPAMLGDRSQDLDAQLDRLQRDRSLGDVALVVRGEHPADTRVGAVMWAALMVRKV